MAPTKRAAISGVSFMAVVGWEMTVLQPPIQSGRAALSTGNAAQGLQNFPQILRPLLRFHDKIRAGFFKR